VVVKAEHQVVDIQVPLGDNSLKVSQLVKNPNHPIPKYLSEEMEDELNKAL
jgi:hypothetical protein